MSDTFADQILTRSLSKADRWDGASRETVLYAEVNRLQSQLNSSREHWKQTADNERERAQGYLGEIENLRLQLDEERKTNKANYEWANGLASTLELIRMKSDFQTSGVEQANKALRAIHTFSVKALDEAEQATDDGGLET